MIRVVRSDKSGNRTYALDEEGEGVLPPSSTEGFGEVGREEAQRIALEARGHYVSHGLFFTVGRQDLAMERKPDCVAFDCDRGLPIAVEIESSNHVQTHPKELKAHLVQVEPFGELHV
jgi:hypothetical protein